MKTVRQWLESIQDEKLRHDALKALGDQPWSKVSADQYAESLGVALIKGFVWNATPQGIYFWRDIAVNADKVNIQ
jgi:hypothetical protein